MCCCSYIISGRLLVMLCSRVIGLWVCVLIRFGISVVFGCDMVCIGVKCVCVLVCGRIVMILLLWMVMVWFFSIIVCGLIGIM